MALVHDKKIERGSRILELALTSFDMFYNNLIIKKYIKAITSHTR